MSDAPVAVTRLMLLGNEPSRRTRVVHWLTLFFALGAIALPDCCLNGRHRIGEGMDAFASICKARR